MRPIQQPEFEMLRRFFHKEIGISLSDQKIAMLSGRLSPRIRACGLSSFIQYYRLISSPEAVEERQIAFDMITTNETYFFRESEQFTYLQERVLNEFSRTQPFRLWCAASSTGEEAYSLAMILDRQRGTAPWSMMASDISLRALQTARRGLYRMTRISGLPKSFLKQYCLKGEGPYENHLLISKSLRQRVDFQQINLTRIPPNLGQFEAIFIRNVIIYFDTPTRLAVLRAVVRHLVPGGYLFLGHSESLQGSDLPVQMVIPATYRCHG